MDAYSEDLRKKIVEAVEKRGTPEAEAARLFGVGISSVRRYLAAAKAGRSLAPKKRPPQAEDGRDRREALFGGRPRGTPTDHGAPRARVPEAGVQCPGERLHPLADAHAHGLQPKKTGGCVSTRQVSKGSLEGDGRRKDRAEPLHPRGRRVARRRPRRVGSTRGRGGASGRFVRRRATGAR